MKRFTVVLALLGLFLAVLSCGQNDPFENHVKGQITLDGQPVADGTISFLPPEGKPASSTTVKGGLFGLDLSPGKYEAEIQLPKRPKEIRAVEVPRDGPKELKFELKSK